MTVVGAAKETENQREIYYDENMKKRNEISMKFAAKLKGFIEFDNNSESGGSSSAEEFDSPKSVWKSDAWKEIEGGFTVLHNQVLKIRHEEDSIQLKSNLEAFFRENNKPIFVTKHILPSSPLSGKTAIRSYH
ncbi:hypothetical protein AQUCO_07400013v1 [Aquilegia coerulea]|uniref:Uncharacterized protein n=1 Tax=Aquilegia coerulea TaxID=218851 RepID=A0A2G5C9C7_AQUCA|nr:hypothetical protein AQUCO_07400013v1 [Aquilegia coerulea]